MFLSIILLPFFGFLVSSLFGRFIGRKGSAQLSLFFMLCTVVFSMIAFYHIGITNDTYFVDLGMWITCGCVRVS